MMSLKQEPFKTLDKNGFVFNQKTMLWTGCGVSISHKDVLSLKLWELDQVIAAAHRGKRSVRLGGNGQREFKLK